MSKLGGLFGGLGQPQPQPQGAGAGAGAATPPASQPILGQNMFRRGQGGIFPERGSQAQYDMVQTLLASALQQAPQSGSPLVALLAPLVAGAVGSRTQGLYDKRLSDEEQAKKDKAAAEKQSAIDALMGAMGGPMGGGGAVPGGGAAAIRRSIADGLSTGKVDPAAWAEGSTAPNGLITGRDSSPGEWGSPAPKGWDRIKAGIFAGESGGDYDALFGFSNRPGGQFANVKLTDMTVDQAIQFADPSGPYGQWVKGKIGRVATPMGGFQIVGTTLKDVKRGMGLSGNERMTPQMQDEMGKYILATQGTGAWEGYRGPRDPSPQSALDFANSLPTQPAPQRRAYSPEQQRQLMGIIGNDNLPAGYRSMAVKMLTESMQPPAAGPSLDDRIDTAENLLSLQKAMTPDNSDRKYATAPDGIPRYVDTGEPVYPGILPKDNQNDAGILRQKNEATTILGEAISDMELQGLSREEALAEIAKSPLYAAQLRILGINPDDLTKAKIIKENKEKVDNGGFFGSLFGGGEPELPGGPTQPAAPQVPDNDPLGIRQ